MVRFGEILSAERWEPWAQQYIDYDKLKDKLEDIVQAAEDPELNAVYEARRHIFQGAFDAEVTKVLAFYIQQEAELLEQVQQAQQEADKISSLASGQQSDSSLRGQISQQMKHLQVLGKQITHLLEFVSLNMRGIRKITKKLAKHTPTTEPVPGFLTLEISHPHDPAWKVLQGTYLPAALQDDLDHMQHHEKLEAAGQQVSTIYRQLLLCRNQVVGDGVDDQAHLQTQNTLVRMDSVIRTLQDARKSAARNANLVVALSWASRRAGIFEAPPAEEEAVATTMGLALNCVNSCLYMANYNLVVPSIKATCGHIGAPIAAVGLIIGCCDLASMPATVGYSVWTNYQFKAPLVFSALSCILGNLIYVTAYDARSLTMLYLARLATGLGSSRSVNRRYIADFVSKTERTKASAAFVASSAVGMALGPLLSQLLAGFPYITWHGISLNPITLGAWVMSLFWIIFLFFNAFYFEDPRKRVPLNPTDDKPKAGAADHHDAGSRQPLLAAVQEEQLENGTASQSAAAPNGAPSPDLSGSVTATLLPVGACIVILLVLKTVQQAYIDGLPLFTQGLYGWTDGNVGTYLAVVSLSMLPLNVAVGAISGKMSDRFINAASLLLTLVGCLQLMKGGFPRWNYFLGGLVVFGATIVLEGASMSLMSKVIHPAMAKGTFNAGLFSTEAGTLGRFAGNIILSIVGRATGVDTVSEIQKFAWVLNGSLAAMTSVAILYLFGIYHRLAV